MNSCCNPTLGCKIGSCYVKSMQLRAKMTPSRNLGISTTFTWCRIHDKLNLSAHYTSTILLQIRLLPPLESNPQLHLHHTECWYLKLENEQENIQDKELKHWIIVTYIISYPNFSNLGIRWPTIFGSDIITLFFTINDGMIKLTRVHNLKESTLTFFCWSFYDDRIIWFVNLSHKK